MRKIKNIFIDTSIFESDCFRFDEESKIGKLIKYKNDGDIKLFITDIIKNEVIARIKSNIKEEYLKFNNLRIIKNINYKSEEDLIKEAINNFKSSLNHFIIIDTDNNIAKTILNNYFDNKPPFDNSSNKKKHEFPDAFIIETIKNWAKNNGNDVIFLCNDKDCKTYIDALNGLIVLKNVDDINNILDEINSEKDCYKQAQLIAHDNLKKISEELEKIVSNIPFDQYKIYYASIQEYMDGFVEPNYDLTALDYCNNFKILNKNIIDIDTKEKLAYMTYKVSYNILAYFEMEDYSMAHLDDEDDIWYGVQFNSKENEYTITLEDIEFIIDVENNRFEINSNSKNFFPEIEFFKPLNS